MSEYDGPQVVGIDLHRRRSVIVRQTESGERLAVRRMVNDPAGLMAEIGKAGPNPRVVLEATYGWYWAADALAEAGAEVHLAHPLGVKGFSYRRVKNDVRDASDLADLLRLGRLPGAWIAPPAVRAVRELVRHRAKLVNLRSGLKAGVHAVLAKQGGCCRSAMCSASRAGYPATIARSWSNAELFRREDAREWDPDKLTWQCVGVTLDNDMAATVWSWIASEADQDILAEADRVLDSVTIRLL